MLLAGAMATGNEELVWNDDQSWAFPVLPVEDNGGKLLIDCGKIVTDATAVSDEPNEVAKGKKPAKRSAEGGCGGGGESDDHELHIWTERERRKKMRNMFASLQALIPHLHPRADKSTIVDEAVVYIKTLQQISDDLEKRKQEKLGNAKATACDAPPVVAQSREAFLAEQSSTSMLQAVTVAGPSNAGRAAFKTWSSPNVVLNVCGQEAHINIVCSPTRPGVLTNLVSLMNKFDLDLVSAHVSSDPTARNFMVHVRVNGILQQLPETEFLAEETYKQAAAELINWLNS